MKIFLADLGYTTEHDYAQIIPLNVAMVASYTRHNRPDADIRLFKDPNKLLAAMTDTPPDVLGLSQYAWNLNLNIAMMKRARAINPAMLIVAGGPNFNATSPDWIEGFFGQRPELDLYIFGEGEWSFNELIGLVERHGSWPRVPVTEWPSSFFAVDRATGTVLKNPDRVAERAELETIPSPYLTGMLDEFLEDERLCPIIETNRGCPYSCTFCCWGTVTASRLHQHPIERVIAEIEYIAQRSRQRNAMMYIADGNFGILKRDLEISQAIKRCSDEYGIPKTIYVYYAKNTTETVVEIAKNLRDTAEMSMSKQSINPDVLERIKRKNISNDRFDELKALCDKEGIKTFCELIYGLPGESYESFMDGVTSVVRTEQRIILQPLREVDGSEMASSAARRQDGVISAFRVMPRFVGSFGDLHSLEYEELVVGNNALPRSDYERIRLFHFLMFVFGTPPFAPLRRALRGIGSEHASLCRRVAEDEANWAPEWAKILNEFQEASRAELIPPDRIKTEFTRDDVEGVDRDGIALNPRYMARLVSSRKALAGLLSYLEALLPRAFGDVCGPKDMAELQKALSLSFAHIVCFEDIEPVAELVCDFDLEAWLSSEKTKRMGDFAGTPSCRYRLSLRAGLEKSFDELVRSTDDVSQAVYRLRMHVFSLFGDWIFCYERKAWNAKEGEH